MWIKQLGITNLRILKELSLNCAPGINMVIGHNGAGKTSILEAIYLLGRGKSFRHREFGPFIADGSSSVVLTAELATSNGRTVKLGMERGARQFVVRRDGCNVNRRSELMKSVPVHLVSPQSHDIVEKGPELRRKALDHGMFHVEQDYHVLLANVTKLIRQRNAALRTGDGRLASSYDGLVDKFGTELTVRRERYVQDLVTLVTDFVRALGLQQTISLRLLPGWKIEDGSLSEQLASRLRLDLKQGMTSVGPHRADLIFRIADRPAERVLSRGQQKLLLIAFTAAQITMSLQNDQLEPPILLIDDFTAELDPNNQVLALEMISELGVQVFLTAISDIILPSGYEARLFHVEHGKLISP